MAEEQARRYPRVSPRMELGPVQGTQASSNDLMRAFQGLLDRMLSVIGDSPDVITYTEVSIATRAGQIVENLAALGRTRFSRLLSDKPTKSEMVGLFIAMLELVRQGKIIARQADNFSDIVIERREAPAEPEAHAVKRPLPPPAALFAALARVVRRAVRAPSAPSVFPAAPPVTATAPRKRARRSAAPFGLFPKISGRNPK
jgi:hypothetical protein